MMKNFDSFFLFLSKIDLTIVIKLKDLLDEGYKRVEEQLLKSDRVGEKCQDKKHRMG